MVLDLFKIIGYNLRVIEMLMIVVYIVKTYFRSPSDLYIVEDLTAS